MKAAGRGSIDGLPEVALPSNGVTTPDTEPPSQLPTSLRWLAVGTFALGTEAFVIAGVLPEIADDLQVSQSAVGFLVAMFALTYGLSAPIVNSAVARREPKMVLRTAMGLFVLANFTAAAAPTFATLLAARMIAGVFAAAFAPTASATASELAHKSQRGRALAVVFGGMSMAMVAGVPLGTVLSDIGSWRTTFVFVAMLGAVAGVGIHVFVPAVHRSTPVARRRPMSVLRTAGVRRCLAVAVLVRAADFAVFTYLAAIVTDIYGNPRVTVPVVLLVNGSVGWFGTTMSGKRTDREGAQRARSIAIAGSAVGLALLVAASNSNGLVAQVVAVPALVVWSFSAWGFGPPQQSRLLDLAPEAPVTALAINASATQIGIGLGGLVGAVTVAASTSASIPMVGVVLAVAALALSRRASPAGALLNTSPHTNNRKGPR
ncbi:MAG: MFS transporter [Ilumatobacter sp.]|uniref:MFS transporter n=1 Tax=Ilumatobacter sp. TaxID=1967498 RepID=UPI003C7251C0